jgi:hypothetical protein
MRSLSCNQEFEYVQNCAPARGTKLKVVNGVLRGSNLHENDRRWPKIGAAGSRVRRALLTRS